MAKKPTISTITTNYNLAQYVNSNFEAIRDHFEGVLSLDGSTPNSMQADLDLNGNSILNAGAIEVDGITVGGVTFVPNDAATVPDWEGAWTTSTSYVVNDLVYNSGNSYICVEAHTSSVFSSDLSSGYWELFASKGDSGAGTGDLLSTENLSDLDDADTALVNLGGGSKGIAIFKDTTSAAVRTEIGLGTAAVANTIDEDDMASDSATEVPTQQSVKAYVDTSVSTAGPAAWVSFDGTTATILDSVNVSSVTRNGVGDYTVNFTTDMANTNYVAMVESATGGGSSAFALDYVEDGGLAVGSVRVRTAYINNSGSGWVDRDYVYVLIFSTG